MAINIELIGQILSIRKRFYACKSKEKKEIFFKRILHVKCMVGRLGKRFLTQKLFSQARRISFNV